MSNNAQIQEVFNELFIHLEKLETMSEGILLYLKEKKRVTDKQLSPYMEQAGNASNVKWRAARVRVERLLTAKDEESKAAASVNIRPEIAKAEQEQGAKKEDEKKQASEQSPAKSKDHPPQEQVASPELEAAIRSHSKHESEQKKKAADPDQNSDWESSERQTTSRDERKESADKQKRVSDQPIQANKPQEPKHEEANHPTEMTQEIAQHDRGRPVDEMKPKDKSKDKEAA
jgi:trichohyalin